MVSAISSSIAASLSGAGASAAILQAQLDRYQKQLSDCVNCSSAKTPEGQAAIRDLLSKISVVKARIEQTTAAKPNAPAAVNSSKDAPVSGKRNNIAATAASSSATTATVGSILNVFA
ncbi:MAG: hypothetical protein ACHP7O_00340 [Burkholderiales bacterium]